LTPGEDTPTFQENHLPFSQRDFRVLRLVVESWVGQGFTGNLNTESAERGYITFIIPFNQRESRAYFGFEIHKLKGKSFLFWRTTQWVARLFTCQSLDGAFAEIGKCLGHRYSLMSTLNAVVNLDVGGDSFGREEKLEQLYVG
jgi:hypothetical protein